jgi:uncharacterized protein
VIESAIYTGTLRHRRFSPKSHDFAYPLFMAFLDIDRIPELMRVSPLSGYNRWNWASFCESDHFGDPRIPLRRRLEADAAAHGCDLPGGPIFLLTHLRYLGYNFNLVSFFYCYDHRGQVAAVLAEVNSTFGETHNYWLWDANSVGATGSGRYRCPKAMHVSPFMGMSMDYTFAFSAPGPALTVHMETLEGGKRTFDATLSLTRRPWERKALHAALRRHPWMTAKVIAAIHWEALLLFLKKVPVYTHPARITRGREKDRSEGKRI